VSVTVLHLAGRFFLDTVWFYLVSFLSYITLRNIATLKYRVRSHWRSLKWLWAPVGVP